MRPAIAKKPRRCRPLEEALVAGLVGDGLAVLAAGDDAISARVDEAVFELLARHLGAFAIQPGAARAENRQDADDPRQGEPFGGRIKTIFPICHRFSPLAAARCRDFTIEGNQLLQTFGRAGSGVCQEPMLAWLGTPHV